MRELTGRQEQCLKFIQASITDRGYPPTLREIGSHMGIKSTNGVNDHLRALERKGFLAREDMKSRALRVKARYAADEAAADVPGIAVEKTTVSIPIVGRIAAGAPIYADEHLLETVQVDASMLRGGTIFGLRVQGDSMIEAGICQGDYAFVLRQNHAERGDIVVALIGDEATIKRYYPEKDYIRFQPENAMMAPVLVRASDFKPTMILGIVCGLYRRM